AERTFLSIRSISAWTLQLQSRLNQPAENYPRRAMGGQRDLGSKLTPIVEAVKVRTNWEIGLWAFVRYPQMLPLGIFQSFQLFPNGFFCGSGLKFPAFPHTKAAQRRPHMQDQPNGNQCGDETALLPASLEAFAGYLAGRVGADRV